MVQSSGQINNNQFTLVTHFFPDHIVGTDVPGTATALPRGPDQDISHASARTANILTFHDVFTLNLIGQGLRANFSCTRTP